MLFEDTGGADFEPAPIGNHIARCIRIIDLGTHEDEFYGKDKHEVFFMWELPEEIKTYEMTDKVTKEKRTVTEPFTASKFYTMSLAERAWLRKDLESWRSRPFTAQELEGFDPKAILSAPCMINIIHEPKKRGKGVNVVITAITPLPKSMIATMPPASHDLVYFSLRNFDQAVLESVSKGLQAKIKRSHEYVAMQTPPPTNTPDPFDPFAQQPAQHPVDLAALGAEVQQAVDNKQAELEKKPPVDDGFDDIPF